MIDPDWADADGIAAELVGFYGEGGGAPTRHQWRETLSAPDNSPISVINFVKLRQQAAYPQGAGDSGLSGAQAFMRYGAGSAPRIAAMGGTLTFAGRHERTIIGADEDWDVIVIAAYPNRKSFVRLFLDPDYREAYRHRQAAVERYRAVIGGLIQPHQ